MVLTKLALEAAVVLTIIGIAAALCVGFIMSGPALGGCGNGSCGGWGNCCECKRCSDLWYSHCYSWTCCGYYWSRDDGFTPPLCGDSKCLLYSKHHGDCDCCATFPSEKRTIRRRRRHRQQDLDEVMQRV
ncbi:hypothetical protein PF005_g29936 [Phytophthora fragariae]|uniref:Uncharacterized protein n=1 Tax=Phytophthora fragariae TaxID=53985 RepID=A0A6A3VFR5_9STRA|nr:hypothetical protein PF009_g29202 [Phytophthora fragariae]KAE9060596.1 hypothetical protein PF007_g30548 [Phytophthora fragariae]KAE9065756.1 hypothetical protein PF006_g30388 [Phytophthora fragariae]KAE9164656.1 hypothetical protein PF005_g29936 [Phytophthora fragariae]KAE9171397.1 hypothetical protein PF002_g29833 [Phytophthora fragariae]